MWTQVEVVEFGEGVCPGMDRELATAFQRSLQKQVGVGRIPLCDAR